MKTTLVLDDALATRLKQEAARRGESMSRIVEAALRLFLRRRDRRGPLPPLPTFKSGGFLVDISDRDALYQAMEGR
jgi:hypothetical protein